MIKQQIETRKESGQWVGVKLPLSISLMTAQLKHLAGKDYERLLVDTTLWAIVWPESRGECLIAVYPGAGERLREAFFQARGYDGDSVEDFLKRWPFTLGVGASSAVLFKAFTGSRPGALDGEAFATLAPPALPRDAADFKRCALLLRGVPAWRPRLQEVARGLSAEWAALAGAWDELEVLLDAGEDVRVYERLRELRDEVAP